MIVLLLIVVCAVAVIAMIEARHDGPACQCGKCQHHRELNGWITVEDIVEDTHIHWHEER